MDLSKFGPRGTMAVSCLSFIAIGAVTGALGPALPELAVHTGSSLAAVGSLVTALFLGAIVSLLAAGPLFDRFGQTPVLLFGAVLLALGALGITLGPTLPLVFLCTFLIGLGHGAIDIGTNVLIAEVFAHRRAAALNLLNVFFGVGAVLGPAVASLALRVWHTAMPGLWFAGGLALVLLWLLPRLAEAPPPQKVEADTTGQAGSLGALLRSPILWALGVLTLTYVGVENGMSSWTTAYLARTTTFDTSVGALASAGFWFALAGGRVVAAVSGARFSSKTILVFTLGGALVASALLVGAVGNGPLTLAAVLLIGFCYGPIFPTIFAITTVSFRRLAGTAGSLVVALGAIGGTLLPWLQGILLANAGPSASVLMIAFGAILMLALFGVYNLVSPRTEVEAAPA